MSNHCLLCKSKDLSDVMPECKLGGVTSDSKPWPRAGTLACCRSCGHIQKRLDATWQEDIQQIYKSYAVHAISGGEEQKLFSGQGQPYTRATAIAHQLIKNLNLSNTGQLLDIGCGTGGFLREFHKLRPDWKLHGQEVAAHFRKVVLSLPGVCAFFGSLDEIHEQFDLITMNDVLEHLPNPLETLRRLRSLLRPEGILFARCPNFLKNPFDLIVVDHCSHFTWETIQVLITQAGLASRHNPGEWFPKETGFLVVPSEAVARPQKITSEKAQESCRKAMKWLITLSENLNHRVSREKIGIFGASVAGSWLAGVMPERVSFFVDEDPTRQGAVHLGRPVISPKEIPAGAEIFLAFPKEIATNLYERFKKEYPQAVFLLPPGEVS